MGWMMFFTVLLAYGLFGSRRGERKAPEKVASIPARDPYAHLPIYERSRAQALDASRGSLNACIVGIAVGVCGALALHFAPGWFPVAQQADTDNAINWIMGPVIEYGLLAYSFVLWCMAILGRGR